MSCPNCGAENASGARFCARCGESLARACVNCGAGLAPDARFCSACGTPVETPTPELPEERKLVTILFADVTGSTQLGERLDPERMKEVMSSFFAAMRAEIEAEGGTVEKFIGDAIMAAFGVPAAHEDDPSRALRAVMRMRGSLDALNRELERDHGVTLAIRTGINTGEVIAVTDPRPGEALATGDAVNAAARLEQLAEPGQVVVAERTARAARGFRFRDLGALAVKGKDEPVRAVELIGTAEGAEGAQRGIPGLRAPMIGRDEEMSLLRTVYRRLAAEGQPNLTTVYGDPGVGKSRLTREFAAWAEDQEPRPAVLAGRCLPYGEGVTYWPLAEILKAHTGVLDSDPPDRALEKIRAATETLLSGEASADPTRTAAALAFAMGLEDPSFRLADLAPRQVRLEVHAAWRAFFSELARSAPAVVVVEDIHWADPAMLDLLEEMADRVIGPVLFVCPARPELTGRRPSWGGGRRNFTSIFLEPLSRQDADRLVGFLLEVEDLPESVHERILARAEGNPFFLEEIIRRLIDERRIVRVEDRWRASGDIRDVEIPDTVQAVLAARIDLLASEEKRALQSAAVVGRVFWSGTVGELLNGEGERLEEIFDRLEQRELVSARLGSSLAGEREYIFKHVLTRDVAYESLPRRDRATAHAEVASWIERTAGERSAELAELLAYHFGEAHRGADRAVGDREALRGKAFEYLLKAASGARTRFAVDTAIRLAEEAVALAEGPLERSRALELLGVTRIENYGGLASIDTLKRAVGDRIAGDPDDHLGIAMLCARVLETPTRWPGSMASPVEEAEMAGYLRLGLEHLPAGDSEASVRLLIAKAFWPFSFPAESEHVVSEDEAWRAGEEAERMAMRLGRADLASAALDGLASSILVRGRLGDMEPLRRRLQLAETILEDPWELGDIYANAAWIEYYIGRYADAAAYAATGERRSAEGSGTLLHSMAWTTMALHRIGDWDGALAAVGRAEGLMGDRRRDPPPFALRALAAAACIHEWRGDPAAADRLLAVFPTDAKSREAGLSGSLYHVAMVEARRGDAESAREMLAAQAWRTGRVHRGLAHEGLCDVVAEAADWARSPATVEAARAVAVESSLLGLPAFADRLEGRAAIATGDPASAIEPLARARATFAELGAGWEVALTDLSLAEAHAAAGASEEARDRARAALETFERVGAAREIDAARAVLERPG